jgi:hypothetical protein
MRGRFKQTAFDSQIVEFLVAQLPFVFTTLDNCFYTQLAIHLGAGVLRGAWRVDHKPGAANKLGIDVKARIFEGGEQSLARGSNNNFLLRKACIICECVTHMLASRRIIPFPHVSVIGASRLFVPRT